MLESINWNDEIENSKSFLTSSLMLQSYNKALQLLDNNREYLDLLVSKLLKEEILRKPDLNELLKNLQVSSNKNDSIEIFKSWGKKSNRKKRRSIKLK